MLMTVACLAAIPAAPASAEIVFGSDRCEDGGALMMTPPNPDGRHPCKGGIFRMNDDGTGLTRLTNGEIPGDGGPSGDGEPRWSPDGTKILFSHQTGEDGGVRRLFVMDADGSDPVRLHTAPPYPFDEEYHGRWSPRGTHIVYSAQISRGDKPGITDDSNAIFVVDADGSDPRRVSPGGLDSWSPTFTPDGRAVVFYGAKTHAQHRTPLDGYYRTDLASGRTLRVSWGGIDIAANGVSFSPDGRYVALVSGEPQLFTMRTDGTELTKRGRPGTFIPASWSPLALFTSAYPPSGNDMRSVIYRLDLLGVAPGLQLTRVAGWDSGPDWNPLDGVLPELPVDLDPPIVLIGPEIDLDDPLSFLVTDASGIRRLDASVAKRSAGRCRFVGKKKMGRRRPCSKRAFFRVTGERSWRKRTKWLPAGKYVLRFRATDGRGNRTEHAKRRVVRVK